MGRPKVVARIMPRIDNLASLARPSGCKKLKGGDKQWRIRVGDYRVIYEINDKARTVDVMHIAHQREAYD